MNRRGFLGAILAGCAAPAIVRADSLMRVAGTRFGMSGGLLIPAGALVLMGDGIADDSDALEAALNGLPVFDRASGRMIEDKIVSGAHLRITRTINLGSGSCLTNSYVEIESAELEYALMWGDDVSGSVIANNVFVDPTRSSPRFVGFRVPALA